MALAKNQVHQGDCVDLLSKVKKGSVDLVFADPPFNIGYEYDVYDDKRQSDDYLGWCRKWIKGVHRALKDDGTFWLAIGDEYAAELKIESQKVGFHCRSWVIWYYTFGVNCANKFTRSHAHLFYFVKDKSSFTFRDEDLDNRVPSARELVYNDKRANPKGRLPDDTWIIKPADMQDDDTFVLRPQEIPESFAASEDTWYIPRVAGTFKERAGFHGCQMPEQLLGRIIRMCSNESDLVLDPFSGSATTLAVAKKLGRQHIGFDLSKEYVSQGRKRLKLIKIGDRLNGSPEPSKSARNSLVERGLTKKGKSKASVENDRHVTNVHEKRYAEAQKRLTETGIIEAFRVSHDGFSTDRVVADPDLNQAFSDSCKKLGVMGAPVFWNKMLFRLRKASKLSDIETTNRTTFSWKAVDEYLFASEIAWQKLLSDQVASTLDDILCDPNIAAKFDDIAARFSPGFKPLQYRWAALKLRKQASLARTRAAVLRGTKNLVKLGKMTLLDELSLEDLGGNKGLYLVSQSQKKQLYAGETINLRNKVQAIKNQVADWRKFSETLYIQTAQMDYENAGNLAWQSYLVTKKQPRLNSHELLAA